MCPRGPLRGNHCSNKMGSTLWRHCASIAFKWHKHDAWQAQFLEPLQLRHYANTATRGDHAADSFDEMTGRLPTAVILAKANTYHNRATNLHGSSTSQNPSEFHESDLATSWQWQLCWCTCVSVAGYLIFQSPRFEDSTRFRFNLWRLRHRLSHAYLKFSTGPIPPLLIVWRSSPCQALSGLCSGLRCVSGYFSLGRRE